MSAPAAEVLPNPSGNVLTDRPCAGCARVFTPTRTNQTHCRPSCRQRALEQRRSRVIYSNRPLVDEQPPETTDPHELFRTPFE
jgi:hypothetical protein